MVGNSLQDFIRDLTINADCFRHLLKTYLFICLLDISTLGVRDDNCAVYIYLLTYCIAHWWSYSPGILLWLHPYLEDNQHLSFFRSSILGTMSKECFYSINNEEINSWAVTFFPLTTPGESASTINPLNAWWGGALASSAVLASTKYHWATLPFVIHIFCPLRTYSSPLRTAFVWTPATSEPAPGSVTQ